MRTTRLRVRLRDVEPAVVRVVDVPASSTLPELHHLLQAAVGWTDSHLHRFDCGPVSWGQPDDLDDAVRDETSARLTDLPATFGYLYDFGDGWEHDVEVLGAGDAEPGCRYGEGGCPPEDCGGPHGYAELLATSADPSHGEFTDLDQAATDLLVRQTVGEVPASVRLVLDLAAGGVRLTPGGRLPRVFVRQVQEQRPDWYPFGDRPASTEEDLAPLRVLHHVLREVGLLRLNRGVVTPIRAAADDVEVVRRLRTSFDGFTAVLSELAGALLLAEGTQTDTVLAARLHPMLGPGWTVDGEPITEHDVRMALARLHAHLAGLDLIVTDGWEWRAGPSAQWLLPRATALAHLWTARR